MNKKFQSEEFKEVIEGLFIKQIDDFEQRFLKLDDQNWFIAVHFPRHPTDKYIQWQFRQRNLNNSYIEYLKKNYKDVHYKKYGTELGYWIFKVD